MGRKGEPGRDTGNNERQETRIEKKDGKKKIGEGRK